MDNPKNEALMTAHWLLHAVPQTSRVKISSKILMAIRISDKLKNPAIPSYGKIYSLSTGAAEILIFLVLRVPLVFFYFT
jgi:hypothetical protein